MEQLEFLTKERGRTIGQAALKFIFSEPSIASVFPNIYNEELLTEFPKTSDLPDLTPEELTRIRQLYAGNFSATNRGGSAKISGGGLPTATTA